MPPIYIMAILTPRHWGGLVVATVGRDWRFP